MVTARRPATEPEAKALASAVRLRILRLCLEEALTNKELARRLGAHPATMLHHVRTLVTTGFLAPQPERRGARGAREVPYLATGKSWTVDVGEQGVRGGGQAMLHAFLQEIHLVPDLDQAQMSRLGLRLTDADRDELLSRLTELLDEFRHRPRPADGRPYSVFIALHLDVSRDGPPPS